MSATHITFREVDVDDAIAAWYRDHAVHAGGAAELVTTCSHGITIFTCVRCGEAAQIADAAECEHLIAALGAISRRVVLHLDDDRYLIAEVVQ